MSHHKIANIFIISFYLKNGVNYLIMQIWLF